MSKLLQFFGNMTLSRRFIFNSTLLGVLFFGNAHANELDKILDSLNIDFTAKFSETVVEINSESKLESKGKFSFKKSGLMRFDYEAPDEQIVIIGKNKVWLYDKVLNNVTISELDKIQVGSELILFRDSKSLPSYFLTVNQTENQLLKIMQNQKLLYLKSIDTKNPVSEIQLAYDAKTNRIEQIGVFDQGRGIRIFKFSDFEYPTDMDEKEFVFILPSDVEIIEY